MNTNKYAMRGSALYAKIMKKEILWTYEDPWGEINDSYFKTCGDAIIAANEDFCLYCDENMELINGATREEECNVYGFFFNSQGERVCVAFKEITVEWEYYHGDYKEHGTHWRGL